MRPHRITVVGGGSVRADVEQQAEALGCLIAERGWVLVNGGRPAGVMEASARGCAQAGGTVIGLLPGSDPADASEHVTLPIATGLGDARNVVNVLAGEVVVALEGGAGTLSEVALALKSDRPVVVVGWQSIEAFERWGTLGRLKRARDVDEAVALVEAFLDAP